MLVLYLEYESKREIVLDLDLFNWSGFDKTTEKTWPNIMGTKYFKSPKW